MGKMFRKEKKNCSVDQILEDRSDGMADAIPQFIP